jgi:hypothetical protein
MVPLNVAIAALIRPPRMPVHLSSGSGVMQAFPAHRHCLPSWWYQDRLAQMPHHATVVALEGSSRYREI